MADTEEPVVKIAGQWVPTHRIWKMLETVNTATDLVERFNQQNPDHASSITTDAVTAVRERLKALDMSLPKSQDEKMRDLAEIARKLLETMPPEDVLGLLEQEHNLEADLKGLITMVGADAYHDSMRREAEEYVANMITPDQIAELWNEGQRPSPNGGLWSENLVKKTFDLF